MQLQWTVLLLLFGYGQALSMQLFPEDLVKTPVSEAASTTSTTPTSTTPSSTSSASPTPVTTTGGSTTSPVVCVVRTRHPDGSPISHPGVVCGESSEAGDLAGSPAYDAGGEEVVAGAARGFRSKEEEKEEAEAAQREEKGRVHTLVAALSAAVCLVLAAGAYIGILLWRRILQKRYGNSEELINEDDLGTNDADLQHFEGATIQIED